MSQSLNFFRFRSNVICLLLVALSQTAATISPAPCNLQKMAEIQDKCFLRRSRPAGAAYSGDGGRVQRQLISRDVPQNPSFYDFRRDHRDGGGGGAAQAVQR